MQGGAAAAEAAATGLLPQIGEQEQRRGPQEQQQLQQLRSLGRAEQLERRQAVQELAARLGAAAAAASSGGDSGDLGAGGEEGEGLERWQAWQQSRRQQQQQEAGGADQPAPLEDSLEGLLTEEVLEAAAEAAWSAKTCEFIISLSFSPAPPPPGGGGGASGSAALAGSGGAGLLGRRGAPGLSREQQEGQAAAAGVVELAFEGRLASVGCGVVLAFNGTTAHMDDYYRKAKAYAASYLALALLQVGGCWGCCCCCKGGGGGGSGCCQGVGRGWRGVAGMCATSCCAGRSAHTRACPPSTPAGGAGGATDGVCVHPRLRLGRQPAVPAVAGCLGRLPLPAPPHSG